MNYKIIIFLFVLLLFVFILGTNILQIEGLRTIEEVKKGYESQTTINNNSNSNVDLKTNNSYDNYNHYKKTSIPTIFYGENESKVILDTKTKTLYLIDISGNTTTYNSKNTNMPAVNIENDLTDITFYSNNGSVAKIHKVNNVFIKITDTNGNIQIYKVDYTPIINTHSTIDTETDTDTQNYNNSPTTYYGSTGDHIPPMPIIKEFNENDKSDLYILKSKIVPPLCPANQIIHKSEPLAKPAEAAAATAPKVNNDTPVIHNKYSKTYAEYPEKYEIPDPVIKCQNNTNDFSGNLFQTPSQYKPHLTSYATSQVEGNKFNKFKSVNSINSEFMPIPVLNSFHSFGK